MRYFLVLVSHLEVHAFLCESHCFLTICIGAFEDPDIIHVDDAVDPVRDLDTISAELRLKVCFTSL